jgi:predicted RNase H-like HicB family nuclease
LQRAALSSDENVFGGFILKEHYRTGGIVKIRDVIKKIEAEQHPESGRIKTMNEKGYAIVIEPGPNNFSAYVPDLPGCISTGHTEAEVKRNIREAIELHLSGMREDGEAIPEPTTLVDYVALAS